MGRGGGGGVSRGGGGSFGGSRGGGGRVGGSFGSGRGSSGGTGSFGSGRSSGSHSPFVGGSSYRPSGSGSFGGAFLGGYVGSRMGRGSGGGNNGGGNGGGGKAGCGCAAAIIIVVIVIIIIAVIFSLNSYGDAGIKIAKSTIEREPLPKGSVNETDYYTDELGWIESKSVLVSGLKHFYDKTGVQPYVYITDTVNGSHYPSFTELQSFAESLYDELFTDEAHILLVFFEYSPGDYMEYYVTGTQAKGVIDAEAGDILLDYLDTNYYNSALSEAEMFGGAFSDAADRIMEVTKSPWIPVLVVLGIIIIVVILFIWWKRVKKQKNLESEQTEKILNTPIERFSDSEAEDLAKKYEDKKD